MYLYFSVVISSQRLTCFAWTLVESKILLCFRPLWILLLLSSISQASVSSVLNAAKILLAHWYKLSSDNSPWLIVKHFHAFKELSVLVVILKFLLVWLCRYQLVSSNLTTPLISKRKAYGLLMRLNIVALCICRFLFLFLNLSVSIIRHIAKELFLLFITNILDVLNFFEVELSSLQILVIPIIRGFLSIFIDTSMNLLLTAQVILSLTHAALELMHLTLSFELFFLCLLLLQLCFLSIQYLTIFDLMWLLKRHVDVYDSAANLQLAELTWVNIELISNQNKSSELAQIILKDKLVF